MGVKGVVLGVGRDTQCQLKSEMTIKIADTAKKIDSRAHTFYIQI